MSEEVIPKVGDVLLVETRMLDLTTRTLDKVTEVRVSQKKRIVHAGSVEFVWSKGRGEVQFASGASSKATLATPADIEAMRREYRRVTFWNRMRTHCKEMTEAAGRRSVPEAKAAIAKMENALKAYEEDSRG